MAQLFYWRRTHVVVLRKGEKLYSGRVDEMISSHGFFELKSDDNTKLISFLENHASIEKTVEKGDVITAFLKEPLSASEFNKQLFNSGIFLSHLVMRKESLEEQFLKLTDNTSA